MNAKEFFNKQTIAGKAFEAFKESKPVTIVSDCSSCICECEPTEYGVFLRAWEAETGLDCEDANEFEAEVEELYLELLAKSEREQKEEQLHIETLNYTSNFI